MPNRIIRESLLDSSRYLSVDEGAQLLYTHLLLLADDFGCLSLEYSFIGRRCFVNRPTAERLDRLVAQLVDVDLIRIYEHRNLRFAFIPRFRQRLKRDTLKNPQPPEELLADDFDAQEKFNLLKGRTQTGAAVRRPGGGGGQPGGGPPDIEVKRSEVKRSEVKRREGKSEGKGGPVDNFSDPVELARAIAERQTRLIKK
jgi:hypothetical protein